ncbi:MAG: DUF4386 domain-containing protein [Candidatus Acidiferrum sp.]
MAYSVVNLIAYAFCISVTLLFYYLFKPVSPGLSFLAAFFSLLGCEVSSLFFFGPYCILIGYLIFKSMFLPRILGVLMGSAGVGWFLFLSPLVRYLSTGLKVLGFVAEMSLMLWLIVKGVNVRRWTEQANAARMPISVSSHPVIG